MVFFLQLLSVHATILKKKYTRENVNNLYSKIAYFIAQSEIFITAKLPKTSPNLIFCSMAHRGTYVV